MAVLEAYVGTVFVASVDYEALCWLVGIKLDERVSYKYHKGTCHIEMKMWPCSCRTSC